MWMKADRCSEDTNKSNKERGLLRCPMCKGRGYFEPTQVTITKNFEQHEKENENEKKNVVKFPQLPVKADGVKCKKLRYKFSLPSIHNVKNLPENRYNDRLGMGENQTDYTSKELAEKQLGGSGIYNKLDSTVRTGTSNRLSAASSTDSFYDKNLIPPPRTPNNPKEDLKTSLNNLKNTNWTESVNALKEIVQIARYHPELLESSMVFVYRGIINLLKSFRSIVVRTACQVSNELFATMANTQRPEFDEVVGIILQKTADTNKIVRQDANEALDTMVINIPPNHSVRAIVNKGITHKSPLVRTATARLLVCVVGVVGTDEFYNGNKETRGHVMSAAATFMQDGSQEVRSIGRRLMKMLMRHESFDDVFHAEVKEVILKRIEKSLVTMRYKT